MGKSLRHYLIKSSEFETGQSINVLKWPWADHFCRRNDNRWSCRVFEWRPRLGKRSVGRPATRWSDDIRLSGSCWIREAQDSQCWRNMEASRGRIMAVDSLIDRSSRQTRTLIILSVSS